ncbi:hypothetical protein AB0K43_27545 [Kitasatospora sp. NPDC049258]|uniref:hypothetical protein n=1 Tax=Kitasatospora sp. NPDC049258 TaxID=3155394 RepID=UPI0034288915
MYGNHTAPLPPSAHLTPSAGRRSRIGLLAWFVLQWVWVPVDLLARLLIVPCLVLSEVLSDGQRPDREWLRFLARPATRWVGPVRFVREWGPAQGLWDAHLNRLCDTALRVYERQSRGAVGVRGWAFIRHGAEGRALLISPKDYRGLSGERIQAIAAGRGLVARSAGPLGITLVPAGGRKSDQEVRHP